MSKESRDERFQNAVGAVFFPFVAIVLSLLFRGLDGPERDTIEVVFLLFGAVCVNKMFLSLDLKVRALAIYTACVVVVYVCFNVFLRDMILALL